MIPAATTAGVDSETHPSGSVVGTPGTCTVPVNQARAGGEVATLHPSTPPDRSRETMTQAAEAASPVTQWPAGSGIEFQSAATRERSVLSLCGKRMVWTDDRRCGCHACFDWWAK